MTATRRRSLPATCPEFYLARNRAIAAIGQATSQGRLLYAYQRTCVDCGADAQVYDHRDYSKPYEVDPVCQRCNLARGRAMWHGAATFFSSQKARGPHTPNSNLARQASVRCPTLRSMGCGRNPT